MAIITSLVAYYSCDEASGDLIDAHGPHDLVEGGGTVAAGTAKVGSGSRTFAVADTEWATVADHADFNMGAGAWSIAFWAKHISVAGTQYYVSKQKTSSAYNGYGIYASATGVIHVETSDGTLADTARSSTAVTDLGWHHIAVTRSGSTVIIYVDGTQDVSGTGRSGSLDHAVGFFAGSDSVPGASSHLDAHLDELGVWKGRALASADVTWLYNSGSGRSYADIVAEDGGVTPKRLLLLGVGEEVSAAGLIVGGPALWRYRRMEAKRKGLNSAPKLGPNTAMGADA